MPDETMVSRLPEDQRGELFRLLDIHAYPLLLQAVIEDDFNAAIDAADPPVDAWILEKGINRADAIEAYGEYLDPWFAFIRGEIETKPGRQAPGILAPLWRLRHLELFGRPVFSLQTGVIVGVGILIGLGLKAAWDRR